MKPKKIKSRVMWLVVNCDGKPLVAFDVRRLAREEATLYHLGRVVRVRVTEAP